MNLKFDDQNLIKRDFKEKLSWFEDEFDMIFNNKNPNYTKNDLKLANEILEKLSETINEHRNEKLLFDLVSTLNNIEKKHPEFF